MEKEVAKMRHTISLLAIAILMVLIGIATSKAQGVGPGASGGRPTPAQPGSKDTSAGANAVAPTDPKISNALTGIRDYEVTYDKTKSHAENTPADLKSLDVTYAGDESPVAKRTKALKTLNLKDTLKDRYKIVEDKHAADPKKDFSPDDPNTTLNYFQPRPDPFSIPDQIPDELRPKYEGAGLEGEVDPEVLRQLWTARFTANLRFVQIAIIGTMQNGPYRVCFYTFPGSGRTYTIQQGARPQCRVVNGLPISISAIQISEDYVVLSLTGSYDYGCNYAATNPVIRTFHVSR